jgi:uncharacterized protein YdaU (DUF1376 family)
MDLPYIPFFIGDYLKETRHLTTEEHGAYLLLILEYWVKQGALPDDDAQLARITGLTPAKWRKVRPVVKDFFRDGWKHPRIDAELEKASALTEKRRAAANVRWRAAQGDSHLRLVNE